MIKVTVQQVLRKHWSHGFILGRLETSLFYLQSYLEKKSSTTISAHKGVIKTQSLYLLFCFLSTLQGDINLQFT